MAPLELACDCESGECADITDCNGDGPGQIPGKAEEECACEVRFQTRTEEAESAEDQAGQDATGRRKRRTTVRLAARRRMPGADAYDGEGRPTSRSVHRDQRC